jgi:IS5 family transposase
VLTGGEAHDFPLAKRLIRRVNPPEHLLGDMAYDGDELREELERHRTKSVIPNRPNRRRRSASQNASTSFVGASRAPSTG